MAGFLALPREAADSAHPQAWFPGDPIAAQLFVLYATRACWKDATVAPREYGRSEPLRAGQLIIGTVQIAKETGRTRQQVRRANHRLIHKWHAVNQQSNQRNTIITICDYERLFLNWPDAQPTEEPQENHRGTTDRPHKNKRTREQENNESPPTPPLPGGDQKNEISLLGQEAEAILKHLCRADSARRTLRAEAARVLRSYGIDVMRAVKTWSVEKQPGLAGSLTLDQLDFYFTGMRDKLAKERRSNLIPIGIAREVER